jgi:hypothetical protein
MSKIADEQIKLTASFLNGIAVALVVAGAVAPLAALTYGLPGAARGGFVALFGGAWILAGAMLHLVARRVLRRLTP